MSEHSHDHAGDHADDHAHGSFKTYMGVFLGLVILTVISFFIGNSNIKHEAPEVAWAGMMAVSFGKAMLVICFFMHLKWEANWKYVLTIPSLMMSVFLLCMLIPDVGLRSRAYSNSRIIHAPRPAVQADAGPASSANKRTTLRSRFDPSGRRAYSLRANQRGSQDG